MMPEGPDGRARHPLAVHSNPVTQAGYTMIPNVVVLRRDLGPMAKLLYGYLKHLAWKNNEGPVDPPREVIALDLSMNKETVTKHLRELQRAPSDPDDPDSPPLVEARRRGQGLPNVYVVNDPLTTASPSSRSRETRPLEDGVRPHPARARQTASRATTATASGEPDGSPAKAPAVRPRNVVYDALAEACGIRPELLSKDSPIFDKDLARMVGSAQGSIRGKARGLDDATLAAEVHLRAQAYRRKWPSIDLTPTALAKHWNTVINTTRRRLTAGEIANQG